MSNVFAVWREGCDPGAAARAWGPEAKALVAGDNLLTGEESIEASYGQLTARESDLLLLVSAIFAADRATARGLRDRICRTIEVHVPVHDLVAFMPLAREFQRLLRDLSQDGWKLYFRGPDGRASEFVEETLATGRETNGRTLLFSGGLDSLAAAVEFGRDASPLQLVSHVTRNPVTDRAQRELAALLVANGFNLTHTQHFISSRDGGPSHLEHAVEASQRTRSLVFLALGAIAGRRLGTREIIYMAENGQMAIHLPLTHGRVGAFSTHTAHPNVLARAEALLSSVLQVPLRILNPYVYETKAEVTARVLRAPPEAVALSTSCWKNTRVMAGGSTHCGACVPCYLRRIALEYHGADSTVYARDPWREDVARLVEDDEARRNLVDLAEFIVRFTNASTEEIMSEYPELRSERFDAEPVIEMYRRSARESHRVLSRYSQLAFLLS